MSIAVSQVVPLPREAIPIPQSYTPCKLTGWDHIAFSVPDLVAAERWYVEVLGAEVVGRYNWGGDTSHPVRPHEDVRIGAHVISLFLGEPLEEIDAWRAHQVCAELSGPHGQLSRATEVSLRPAAFAVLDHGICQGQLAHTRLSTAQSRKLCLRLQKTPWRQWSSDALMP